MKRNYSSAYRSPHASKSSYWWDDTNQFYTPERGSAAMAASYNWNRHSTGGSFATSLFDDRFGSSFTNSSYGMTGGGQKRKGSLLGTPQNKKQLLNMPNILAGKSSASTPAVTDTISVTMGESNKKRKKESKNPAQRRALKLKKLMEDAGCKDHLIVAIMREDCAELTDEDLGVIDANVSIFVYQAYEKRQVTKPTAHRHATNVLAGCAAVPRTGFHCGEIERKSRVVLAPCGDEASRDWLFDAVNSWCTPDGVPFMASKNVLHRKRIALKLPLLPFSVSALFDYLRAFNPGLYNDEWRLAGRHVDDKGQLHLLIDADIGSFNFMMHKLQGSLRIGLRSAQIDFQPEPWETEVEHMENKWEPKAEQNGNAQAEQHDNDSVVTIEEVNDSQMVDDADEDEAAVKEEHELEKERRLTTEEAENEEVRIIQEEKYLQDDINEISI